jgi:hypothetical protein
MPADPDQTALFDPGPPAPAPVRRLRRDADRTVRALRAGGRLEAADTLLVALLRTAADMADERRGADGKEFHETQAVRLVFDIARELQNVGGPAPDAFDQLLAAAASTAPPGD